jgi:hypothetical protein
MTTVVGTPPPTLHEHQTMNRTTLTLLAAAALPVLAIAQTTGQAPPPASNSAEPANSADAMTPDGMTNDTTSDAMSNETAANTTAEPQTPRMDRNPPSPR